MNLAQFNKAKRLIAAVGHELYYYTNGNGRSRSVVFDDVEYDKYRELVAAVTRRYPTVTQD